MPRARAASRAGLGRDRRAPWRERAAAAPVPARPAPALPRSPVGRAPQPRRGAGDEAAGSRPYRPGDRTARSTGPRPLGSRRHAAPTSSSCASSSPRRRRASPSSATAGPSIGLYGAAVPVARQERRGHRRPCGSIAASARAARGDLAFADRRRRESGPLRAPAGRARTRRADATTARAARRRSARRSRCSSGVAACFPLGTFVFVVSDFLDAAAGRLWARLRSLRWDVTPVVVQDPVWEQRSRASAASSCRSRTRRAEVARMSGSAARTRAARRANERAARAALGGFRRLGIRSGPRRGPRTRRRSCALP